MQCFTNFYDSNQGASTKAEYSKFIMELLRIITPIFYYISTLWKNTYGFSEQYICSTVIYLLSMLAKAYNIIIDRSIREPVHIREVVDG